MGLCICFPATRTEKFSSECTLAYGSNGQLATGSLLAMQQVRFKSIMVRCCRQQQQQQ